MKAYVILAQTGEYEEAVTRAARVFHDKEKAERETKKLDAISNKLVELDKDARESNKPNWREVNVLYAQNAEAAKEAYRALGYEDCVHERWWIEEVDCA